MATTRKKRSQSVRPVLRADDGWARDRNEPGYRRKMRFQTMLADAVAEEFVRQRTDVIVLLGKVRSDADAVKATGWLGDLERLFAKWWSLIGRIKRIIGGAAMDGVELFRGSHEVPVIATIGVEDVPDRSAHADAAAWAMRYSGQLVKGIDDTTRKVVRDVIRQFVETPGMTLGDAIKKLPFDTRRARLIATTEITRSYAMAEQIAATRRAGQFPGLRVVKRWWTNNDARVCPICAPLHGKRIEYRELFVGPSKLNPDGVLTPPSHPGCRCWMSYVSEVP